MSYSLLFFIVSILGNVNFYPKRPSHKWPYRVEIWIPFSFLSDCVRVRDSAVAVTHHSELELLAPLPLEKAVSQLKCVAVTHFYECAFRWLLYEELFSIAALFMICVWSLTDTRKL